MRRRKNLTSRAALSGIRLLVHAIPHELYGDRTQLAAAIDLELIGLWESLLSEQQHEEWSKWCTEQGELSSAVFHRLDLLILQQAETFGWRLMLSHLVQLRFRAWEKQTNGPQFFERLGRALARSVRILQGKQLPPIDDPGLYDYKAATTRELRAVLDHLRNKTRRRFSPHEAIKAFREIVAGDERFPLLRANLEAWLQFFRETEAAHLRELAPAKRISAAALFDQQRAHYTRYDQETVRQKFSKLRRSNRRNT